MQSLTSNLISPPRTVSQILSNARTHKGRLKDVLDGVMNLRIQLEGEFPQATAAEERKSHPGLVAAILETQEDHDAIVEQIFAHLDAIYERTGTSYHPNCKDKCIDG